nr:uncharacterized protein LOC119175502 [Rhipicephalus microplus]
MRFLRGISLSLLFHGMLATSGVQAAGFQTDGEWFRKSLLLDQLHGTEGRLYALQLQKRTMIDDHRVSLLQHLVQAQLTRTAHLEKHLPYSRITRLADYANYDIMKRSRLLRRTPPISDTLKETPHVTLESRWQSNVYDPLHAEIKTRFRRDAHNTTLRRPKRYIWPFLALSWLYLPYLYSGLYSYSALYSPFYYRYPYYTYGYGYYPYRFVYPVYVNPVQPTATTAAPAAAR